MNERKEKILQKTRYDINDLCEIMAILRDKDGCPWDSVQTHQSIRADFIEEVYEAIEGIDNDDAVLIREELGDVLLQVVFHAQIEKEKGSFDFNDVANDICVKLIQRHPHVFGDTVVNGTSDVLKNWEKIKEETKKRDSNRKVLDSVAKSLPSLVRAQKLNKKAAKLGLKELCTDDMTEQEIADELMRLTSIAQAKGYDAEKLLYDRCESFIDGLCKEDN